MALQERYEKQDEIPEALREHYIEQEDGVFMLENVVGALGAKQRVKSEFDQFKTSSDEKMNTLQSQLDELIAEKKKLADQQEADRLAKLKEEGKTDELHKIEVEKLTNQLGGKDAEIQNLKTQFEQLNDKINQQALDRVASKIAQQIGIAGEDGTIEEIETLLKATGRLKVVDGNVEIFASDGTAISSNLEDFADSLKTEKTYRRLARGTQSDGGFATGTKPLGGGAIPTAFKGSAKDKAAFLAKKHNLK